MTEAVDKLAAEIAETIIGIEVIENALSKDDRVGLRNDIYIEASRILRAPRKEQGALAELLVGEKRQTEAWPDAPNGGREERDAALSDIAAERERQKAVEGWTAEHDDNHVRGEMALAAAAYAVTDWPTGDIASIAKGVLWPWEDKWWKPKDFRSNLVRAAALLVAEIERHDRKEVAIALRAPHVEGKPE